MGPLIYIFSSINIHLVHHNPQVCIYRFSQTCIQNEILLGICRCEEPTLCIVLHHFILGYLNIHRFSSPQGNPGTKSPCRYIGTAEVLGESNIICKFLTAQGLVPLSFMLLEFSCTFFSEAMGSSLVQHNDTKWSYFSIGNKQEKQKQPEQFTLRFSILHCQIFYITTAFLSMTILTSLSHLLIFHSFLLGKKRVILLSKDILDGGKELEKMSGQEKEIQIIVLIRIILHIEETYDDQRINSSILKSVVFLLMVLQWRKNENTEKMMQAKQ